MATQPMHDQTFKSLMRELIDEIARLIRGELRLAQAEGHEKIAQIQSGTLSIVSGMLLAFAALLVLLQATVLALAKVMSPTLAAIVVGVAVALIGWALIGHGVRNLRAQNLIPERTVKSIRDTREIVEERAR